MILLRRYFDSLRAADQEALRVAKEEVDRRLEQMNDLRGQISDERGHYLSTDTYEARHQVLEQRIGAIELWKANLTGRMVVFSILGALLVAVAAALVAHIVG